MKTGYKLLIAAIIGISSGLLFAAAFQYQLWTVVPPVFISLAVYLILDKIKR